MRTNEAGLAHLGPVAAPGVGTAVFFLLPIVAPPVVPQSDEIPGSLRGLGAVAISGAALHLPTGGPVIRGLVVVAASALLGAIPYTFLYAIPTHGLSEDLRCGPP